MRRIEPKRGLRRIKPAVASALRTIVVVLLPTAVRAQSYAPAPAPVQQTAFQETPAEDGARFRAYKLNQLSADAAQQRLTQFFAATPGIEIVADAPRGRVLVRATPQILEQAGELLAKLDPSAPSAPPAQVPQPPTQRLEAYPLTPSAQTILAALEKQAAGRPDIRVAVDQRTSQALVLAPESIHSQIRDKLAQVSREPRVQSSEPARSAAPSSTGESLQLRTLSADDLRLRLERLLSRPLPASTDASGQWQSFAIEAVAGAGVTATVNPTTRELRLSGPPQRTSAWRQVIAALDTQPAADGTVTQLVATKPASQARVRQVLDVVQSQNGGQINAVPKLFAAFQQPSGGAANAAPSQPATAPGTAIQPSTANAQTAIDAANLAQAAGELLGPVQVSFVEGLDVIVLRGNERDVERVMQIIQQIEQLSAVTTPMVEVYDLKNVDSRALGALMTRLYQQVLGPRIGDVSITPLVKPNALLLVGRPENVRMAVELIQRLDQPVLPSTRFEVFPLRNATATTAKTMIDQFLEQTEAAQQAPATPAATESTTLAPKAMIVADVRTNSLIVSAAPRDLTEIAALVARIDSPSGAAVDQVRVFPLRNAVATEMATVLRNAIQGGTTGATTTSGDGGSGGSDSTTTPGARPSALEFRRIGAGDPQAIKSGVLTGADLGRRPGKFDRRHRAGRQHGPDCGFDPAARSVAQRVGGAEGVHAREWRRGDSRRDAPRAVRGRDRQQSKSAAGGRRRGRRPGADAVLDRRADEQHHRRGDAGRSRGRRGDPAAARRRQRPGADQRRLPAQQRIGAERVGHAQSMAANAADRRNRIAGGPQPVRADRAGSDHRARDRLEQPGGFCNAALLRDRQEHHHAARRAAADGDDPGADRRGAIERRRRIWHRIGPAGFAAVRPVSAFRRADAHHDDEHAECWRSNRLDNAAECHQRERPTGLQLQQSEHAAGQQS